MKLEILIDSSRRAVLAHLLNCTVILLSHENGNTVLHPACHSATTALLEAHGICLDGLSATERAGLLMIVAETLGRELEREDDAPYVH